MTFELTNEQREFFGLDPIRQGWDKVPFKGVGFRPDGHLYFDGDTIKRWIISTKDRYTEEQYDEVTEGRALLLPKTARGRALKLSAAMLEKRQPWGPYLRVDSGGNMVIGNHTTQTTFYSTSWDRPSTPEQTTAVGLIERFIADSPASHLSEIARFRTAKRRHVKFKPGDVFSLKLDRMRFGYGRILLDVGTLRKRNLISGSSDKRVLALV